jgi:hypothetical protein
VRENPIQKHIMKSLGSRDDIRIFRNNVGVGIQGKILKETRDIISLKNPRRIRFGLMPGSADLIGWQTVTITPDMVGKKIARFTSIETKRADGGYVNPDQENWMLQVNASGGFAAIVNDPEVLPL